MEILKKIFGDENKKKVKALQATVEKINALEPEMQKLSTADFPMKTMEFKARLAKGESLEDILPEAFAMVREASKRTLGERHYDVQLMGGIVLNDGKISEMRTGEGKTLVATLPTYLNALTGKGVHVVTVNDYLARRDAVWMGQIFSVLGVSCAVINHETSYLYDVAHQTKEEDSSRDETGSFKIVYDFLRPCSRKEAYLADVTYGTNSEFGFDYLRDNISYSEDRLVQREPNYALVDEIDSILIDEARTPLIISSATSESENLYVTFAHIARSLSEGEDYEVDEKLKAITMKDGGINKAEKALGVENIYTEKGIKYVHHLETAVRAKALFRKDKDYVVKDNEVVIVDEFTGRVQPGRRWSEGLHQAIEAKEGALIQKESKTVASITYQNYFRLYKKLSGMTGTAMTSAEEFYKVYGLDVVSIPPNRPSARIDRQDLIFQTETGKFTAIARKVRELNDMGQPVLIGTASIEKNELLSAFLTKEGIPHDILNAKKHEQEGGIIAQSGRKASVVIATNMAGRGVDIKLGGNPHTKEEYDEVKSLGGLYVIGTERHEARRIDNQLRGRSGRQGDPGETQFYVSLEDSLMRVFASDTIKKMMGRFGIPEDEAIQNSIISKSLETAQGKIEGFNFDARKSVLEYDDVMSHQRKAVYERRRKMLLADHEYIIALVDELSLLGEEAQKILDEKKRALGEEIFLESLRRIALQSNDMLWMEHLEMMDYLRNSVRLRSYGQRDPLVEYKKEGLRIFREMEDSWRDNIIGFVKNINTDILAAEAKRMEEAKIAMERATIESGGEDGVTHQAKSAQKNEEGEKIGRNDVCPCGSGKKYKKCHGA